MTAWFGGNDSLSGRHLSEFLLVLNGRYEKSRQEESSLLAMRDKTNKPKDYQNKLQYACEKTNVYEWLCEKIADRADSELTAQQLTDIISSYRGRQSQPALLSKDHGHAELLDELVKSDRVGTMFIPDTSTRETENLGWLKLMIREHCLEDFLGLHHLQERKMDEWIVKGILELDNAPPDLCKNGMLNPDALNNMKLRYDNDSTLKWATTQYTWSLKMYQDRPHPGGLLDVYHKAKIQYTRSFFEKALAAAYPDLGAHQLQLKGGEILGDKALEYQMDSKTLQSGLNF